MDARYEVTNTGHPPGHCLAQPSVTTAAPELWVWLRPWVTPLSISGGCYLAPTRATTGDVSLLFVSRLAVRTQFLTHCPVTGVTCSDLSHI